jgi:hypothetical protein
MESWYPLGAFVESRIWAQLMRQISRRAADVGIICNWRNGLVNPGAAVQYPDDDFLVGLSEHPITVCQEYMEQIFGTLEDVCEATYLEDCKLWFFAPNEGTLPFCSGLDGVEPMVFTQPTLVEDRRKWKNWMTRMRQVVDALDRLKTVWPIPHPATLYALQTTQTYTYDNQGWLMGSPVVVRDGRPAGFYDNGAPWPEYPDDGYCLDVEDDYEFPGWDSLDGTNLGGSSYSRLKLICPYRFPAYPYHWGAVSETDTDTELRAWGGIGKVTVNRTQKFTDEDWAEFVATYGDVVNTITWVYNVDTSCVPYGDDTHHQDVEYTATGEGTVSVVGNAEIEYEVTIELDLNGQVFKLFDDYEQPIFDGLIIVGYYTRRGAIYSTGYAWGEDAEIIGTERYGFLDNSGFGEWSSSGFSLEWQWAVTIDEAASQITACDI